MLLLDTNVVSEAFRTQRHPAVQAWFDTTSRDELYLSSITKAELLFGLAIMPAGKRKVELAGIIWRFLAEEMRTGVLEFGSVEAEHYAEIAASRRGSGRPISQSDAQIAAIARAGGFALVTRNVGDFEDCGIDIINPWVVVE
jgi:toxin FitB